MKLHFGKNGRLPASILQLIHESSESNKKEISALTDRLGAANGYTLTWWLSELSARNIYATRSFADLCHLTTIKKLLESRNDLTEISVSSRPLYRVLKKRYRGDAKVTCHFRWSPDRGELTKYFLKPVANWSKSAVQFALRYLAAFSLPSPKLKEVGSGITLINLYVSPKDFDHGTFKDRYFAEMLKNFSSGERERFYYVPAVISTWNFRKLFRKSSDSGSRFLFRESLLRWSDYWFALRLPFAFATIRIPELAFQGFDVAPLFRAAKWYTIASPNSLEGGLCFRFGKRLTQFRQNLRLVVDWFENQPLSRGVNAGIRWHMPEVPVVGYQGFFNPLTMISIFPTTFERDSRVIPEQVAVMGEGWKSLRREFCPDLELVVAPAFRFSHLHSLEHQSHEGACRVLVALPMLVEEANAILDLLCEVQDQLPLGKFVFVLRLHPYLPEKLLRQHLDEGRFEVRWSTGPIAEALSHADVLVSGASSVCFEAISCNVPCIIIPGERGLVHSPIPPSISRTLWAIAYDSEALAGALLRFSNREEKDGRLLASQELRAQYVEPSTREAARRFLRFETEAE